MFQTLLPRCMYNTKVLQAKDNLLFEPHTNVYLFHLYLRDNSIFNISHAMAGLNDKAMQSFLKAMHGSG